MIVVADTSPICYLVLIDQFQLLPQLFGEIAIPQAVYDELTSPDTPISLQSWINQVPNWLVIYSIKPVQDVQLDRLHIGEKEAIILAHDLKADLIIIDEKAARKVAISKGLKVTGLLGILEMASKQNLIDLKIVIERLQKTTFRISPRLIQSLLDRYYQ